MLGSNFGKYSDYHFSKSIYQEFGIHFCKAIFDLNQNAYNSNVARKKEIYFSLPECREIIGNNSKNSLKKSRFQ